MSVSTCDGVGSIGGNIVLPIPFQEMTTIFDHQAKGSWIMVNVSSDWEVSVLKCRPGIRILASTTYNDHDAVTFIQCPNVTRKSSGFIAIGTYQDSQSTVNAFSAMDDGIITADTFLWIVQGVFLSPSGELCYIYHFLRPLTVIRSLLPMLMRKYYDDAQTFCKIAFKNSPSTAIDSSVSFLYLNQIAGPTMSSWSRSSNISIEKGTPFIQASLQPDSWCSTWLSDQSIVRKVIKFDTLEENNWKCKLKGKRPKNRRDVSKSEYWNAKTS